MCQSLVMEAQMPLLEWLRGRLLNQKRQNELRECRQQLVVEGIESILQQKLSRRGIVPDKNAIIFCKSKNNSARFYRYSGGFFEILFKTFWNQTENGIEIEIVGIEHISALKTGIVATVGERYLID